MVVVLEDREARDIARLLKQYDRMLTERYPESAITKPGEWSEELNSRAGPPSEPIRKWIENTTDIEDEDEMEMEVARLMSLIENYDDGRSTR